MTDSRYKNTNWELKQNLDGTVGWNAVHTAVLMDIRDELQSLNRLLHCVNFTEFPRTLRKIEKNTRKKNKATKR